MEEVKIKIDTLIISDIHLGKESVRTDELLAILRKYDFGQLILNGDILNGLHFQRLNTGQWDVLSVFRQLTRTCDVVWVHGNHDAQAMIISRLLGLKVVNKYSWRANGKKYLAIHGHQYDHFLNQNYWTSQLVYALYDMIKNLDRSGALTDHIKRHSAVWARGTAEVRRGAVKLARSQGADCVFCGHTHKPEEAIVRNIHYYNTGSWNEKPSAYATICGGKVVLNRVD